MSTTHEDYKFDHILIGLSAHSRLASFADRMVHIKVYSIEETIKIIEAYTLPSVPPADPLCNCANNGKTAGYCHHCGGRI